MPQQNRTAAAARIAEDIARAQDMLGRLGARDAYEPNYAGEKLTAAMEACAHALGMLGHLPEDVSRSAHQSTADGYQIGTARLANR